MSDQFLLQDNWLHFLLRVGQKLQGKKTEICDAVYGSVQTTRIDDKKWYKEEKEECRRRGRKRTQIKIKNMLQRDK